MRGPSRWSAGGRRRLCRGAPCGLPREGASPSPTIRSAQLLSMGPEVRPGGSQGGRRRLCRGSPLRAPLGLVGASPLRAPYGIGAGPSPTVSYRPAAHLCVPSVRMVPRGTAAALTQGEPQAGSKRRPCRGAPCGLPREGASPSPTFESPSCSQSPGGPQGDGVGRLNPRAGGRGGHRKSWLGAAARSGRRQSLSALMERVPSRFCNTPSTTRPGERTMS